MISLVHYLSHLQDLLCRYGRRALSENDIVDILMYDSNDQ